MQKLIMMLLGWIAVCNVHAGTLSVRAERPDIFKLMSSNSSWNIVLDGEIDADAPKRVAAALAQTGNDGADVFINSPGGSLFAGMQIGRLLRKAGANTYIGGIVPDPTFKIADKVGIKAIPGRCYSACALTFLGGVYRYSTKGSQYGVHRFSKDSGPSASDLDSAQIISAAISAYIREMDVDGALFDLMATAGKDTIRPLSPGEMLNLNVVNNGRMRPTWSIETVDGGFYLRGMQHTQYGFGKSLFFCAPKGIGFQSFYNIGQDKAKSVAKGGWYHSLMVDDRTMPIDPVDLKVTGDEIYALFILTREQFATVVNAKSVGHAMQLSRDAPTFVGYRVDIPGEAAGKVSTFVRNCLR